MIKKLELPINSFDFQSQYSKQLAYYHRDQILELCQWKPFDETICRKQIKRLVERQLMPRKVLFEIQAYLFRARLEAPAYNKYLRIINEIMLEVGKDISRALQDQLNDGHRKILDEFLSQKAAHLKADLIQYRSISQPMRPKDIETSLEQFNTLKSRLELLNAPVQALRLSDAVIDYHAYSASIALVAKIQVHSDKYLFLLCFLIH